MGEFRPSKRGLGKVLGHLEAAVMEIMWRQGEASVRDVYEVLLREREIAYTTVMTIMSRLADKNILQKEKKGLAYVYRPACSRDDFARSVVTEVIDGLLEDYAEVAFSHFVNRMCEEDEIKILELERIIQERQRRGDR
ncbi:CopY family transcriptional regulator [Clostridiales bacterium PH28_bin88]|nr:CopY family transcriptional regulator [Clostridiales bacterium PH28_bin88]